jgi:hypothetical protein
LHVCHVRWNNWEPKKERAGKRKEGKKKKKKVKVKRYGSLSGPHK